MFLVNDQPPKKAHSMRGLFNALVLPAVDYFVQRPVQGEPRLSAGESWDTHQDNRRWMNVFKLMPAALLSVTVTNNTEIKAAKFKTSIKLRERQISIAKTFTLQSVFFFLQCVRK